MTQVRLSILKILVINNKITGNINYVEGTTIEYSIHAVPYPHS